jgi:hypothetical protein
MAFESGIAYIGHQPLFRREMLAKIAQQVCQYEIGSGGTIARRAGDFERIYQRNDMFVLMIDFFVAYAVLVCPEND